MTEFLQSVDARTKLAGRNQLEVLLFSLGKDNRYQRDETYAVNVFKVREVMALPEITRAPDTPASIEGMVSLRGTVVPVINLQKYCKVSSDSEPTILVITEYNRHVQGFLVDSVDSIVRLNWEDVKVPPPMMAAERSGLITSVTELEDGRLVMILDVEKVLADVADFYADESIYQGIQPLDEVTGLVVFVDDSRVARGQVRTTLEHLNVDYMETTNGAEAWERLKEIAERCTATGQSITNKVAAVLTDIEMPEMDGYVLTQNIKQDERLKDIPVLMHSSLSGNANLGESVGVDDYVPKFDPQALADTLRRYCINKIKN